MLQIVFGVFFGQSRKGDESMLSHLLSQREREASARTSNRECLLSS